MRIDVFQFWNFKIITENLEEDANIGARGAGGAPIITILQNNIPIKIGILIHTL